MSACIHPSDLAWIACASCQVDDDCLYIQVIDLKKKANDRPITKNFAVHLHHNVALCLDYLFCFVQHRPSWNQQHVTLERTTLRSLAFSAVLDQSIINDDVVALGKLSAPLRHYGRNHMLQVDVTLTLFPPPPTDNASEIDDYFVYISNRNLPDLELIFRPEVTHHALKL
ncbi:MAG: hypothetical protein EXX96DRAFT_612324 [Benjaminiella poitrasii]|nr:MAG: hypothetical protein EXX96DRAFT_612324 [Benjaminiella poitrasii]